MEMTMSNVIGEPETHTRGRTGGGVCSATSQQTTHIGKGFVALIFTDKAP